MEGTIQAPTQGQARLLLLRRFPDVHLVELASQGKPSKRRLRVPSDLVAAFYRRLATMVASGISIDRALDFLQEAEDPRLATVIKEVLDGILGGRSMSAAMSRPEYRSVFPPIAVGLVSVGEHTGSLVEAMNRLADLAEREVKLRRMVTAALVYPAVLAVVILAVAILFILIIAPGDRGLFGMFGGELPWPTRVLVSIGDVLRNPVLMGGLVLGVGLTVGAAVRFVQRVARARYALDDFLLKVPFVEDVIRKMAASRMLYVLSLSIQVGVPITEALEMAREMAGNQVIAARLDEAARAFTNGTELGDALERFQVLPRLVTIVVNVGQETGNLDPMLARVSALYEEEVETALTNLARLLEPILLAVAGVVAVFVSLATLLPIIEFVNRI